MRNLSTLLHEQLYRGTTLMQQLGDVAITICGAGALGANICENLARAGVGRLRLIDFDRVEVRNLSTQPFFLAEAGTFKAKTVANNLYRALGIEVEALSQRLEAKNIAKLLMGSQLVIDVFDNSPSRQLVRDYCTENRLVCLHAGLAAGYSEIIWNEGYRVPSAAQDDICDYPLARNLVMLTAITVCEVVIRYIKTQEKASYTITLEDLAISRYDNL